MTDPGFVVEESIRHFQGAFFDVHTDQLRTPDGGATFRDYVRHLGAVAVVALDEQDQVVLLRQFRYPVAQVLWELPAGLRDVQREEPVAAAARELAEETDLAAGHWEPLISIYTSPGYSDERIQIFLARDLAPTVHGFVRDFEEATMTVHHVPLAQAVAMVDRGEIINGVCAVGLLAAWQRLHPVPPAGE